MTSAPRAPMSADPAAPPPVVPLTRICDDQAFIDLCVRKIGSARTSQGDLICDVLDLISRQNIILQLTEASDIIQRKVDAAAASSGAEARAQVAELQENVYECLEAAGRPRKQMADFCTAESLIGDAFLEVEMRAEAAEQRAAAAEARVALLTEAEWDALAKGAACIVPKVATMEMQKAAVLGFSVGAYTEFTPADAYAAMLAASPYRAAPAAAGREGER